MTKSCFILFSILFFESASAQRDSIPPVSLKTIYISALHINDSLLRAPSAIGILSKSDLTRNNETDISTAINTIPGVLMQSANITTSRVSIRGIGARTPYGTNKIRAFYSNIPLTSGDGETTIDDVDVENIGQVEIIKGPLSSVYGAGLGGAILISPKEAQRNTQITGISSVIGSYGLVKNSIFYAIVKPAASLNINYHNIAIDGWRQNNSYRREGTTISGELFRKSNSKLTYLGNYTYLKTYIASSIDQKTFGENPKAAAPTWLASKGYKAYYSALGGLNYDFKMAAHLKNSTSIFINYRDSYETRPFDILRQYTFASGARTQFSGNFKVATISADFIFGAEYFADDYHRRNLENLYKQTHGTGSLEGNLLTSNIQSRNFYNAFAQLRFGVSKHFELQGGLNVNQTKFTLDNTFPTEIASSQEYSYGAIWSPQIAVLYKPDNLKTIYLSASKGYSLPSVNETLMATGTVNADIKPENGYNYEAGGKFYFFDKSFYTEFALYRMEINDLLVAKRIADDQYVGVNAGKTLHAGIELSINHLWQISKLLAFNWYVCGSIGQYKFVDFIDSGNDFSGNKLTGVPANKANAGISFSTNNGWSLASDFLFVDKIPLNDANSDDAKAYKIVNVRFAHHFEIFNKLESQLAFGINNIFDEHYASLILPNAIAPPKGSPRYYYPGLPINYYVNIRLHYAL